MGEHSTIGLERDDITEIGDETGEENNELPAQKTLNLMILRYAALLMAVLFTSGCGDRKMTNLDVEKIATECIEDYYEGTLGTNCKDQELFTRKLLDDPNCKLLPGDSQVITRLSVLDSYYSKVQEAVKIVVADACVPRVE